MAASPPYAPVSAKQCRNFIQIYIFVICLFFRNLEGEIFLKNGNLKGLANLSRTMPTTLKVDNGWVKVVAGVGVTNVAGDFETTVSDSVPVPDSFSPEVAANVQTVGFRCGVDIPITSSLGTTDRENMGSVTNIITL